MTTYALRRKSGNDYQYLSLYYKWTPIPNAFDEVYFPAVLLQAMNYKDRPQAIGEVSGGDFDAAIWTDVKELLCKP